MRIKRFLSDVMIDKRKLNMVRNFFRYMFVVDEFLDMYIKFLSEWKSWCFLVVKFFIFFLYFMYFIYVMFGLKKEKILFFCFKSF